MFRKHLFFYKKLLPIIGVLAIIINVFKRVKYILK